MLLPIAALLLTYVLTMSIAVAAVFVLWRPLSILLAEVCGTEQRSRFWTVWSAAMMVATPLLLVSMRDVTTCATELVQGTVTSALFGVLLALGGMGFAIWSRTTRVMA